MEDYLRELVTSTFSPDQRAALAVRRADQDRTADAIEQLASALVAAASGRAAVWQRNVADALETLDRAVTAESRSNGDVDSLLSDIARTQPRLRGRVRSVRHHYARISDQLKRALQTLTGGDDLGVAETRMHLNDLISAVQLVRGRESDLIYEAYFDAFDGDVEEELGAHVRPLPSR